MAKPINLPADYVAKHMEKVRNELSGRNYKIDKLKLSIPLESDDRRAIVYFTLKAWTKMNALVRDFKTEVQWHGIADRICENQFIVQDLLIFPHEATEVSVVSDAMEYKEWRDNLDLDTFTRLRFHGHSHVNMRVIPSQIDDEYRRGKLNNFANPTQEDDYFYIFAILNKRGDIDCQIYDITNNARYDDNEVFIDILLEDDSYLSSFVEEVRDVVREPIPKTKSIVNNANQKTINSNVKEAS